MAYTADQLSDEMFEMIKRDAGTKKYKSTDLQKEFVKLHESDGVDKTLCKEAIRKLIDSGRCVYTYFGGSFIEIPHEEGAAKRLDQQ